MDTKRQVGDITKGDTSATDLLVAGHEVGGLGGTLHWADGRLEALGLECLHLLVEPRYIVRLP